MMRRLAGLSVVLVLVVTRDLPAQAQGVARHPSTTSVWGVRAVPRDLTPSAWRRDSARGPETAGSAAHRPFFLPRPGEHTAFWVGFGAGLAISPMLWCDGPGCGTVSKASTSLGLGLLGAVGGLLLSRVF
jgi:hypothetical protein